MFQRLLESVRFGAVDAPVRWPLRGHDRGRHLVLDDRGAVPAGHGVIRFTSRVRPFAPRAERAWKPRRFDDTSRPRGSMVPLLLIDGEPAAAGVGSERIAVPAGQHVVQVQAAASGRYTIVDVPEGGEVRLSSTVRPARFHPEPEARLEHFFGCFSLHASKRAAFGAWEPVGADAQWRVVGVDEAPSAADDSVALLRINVVYLHDCELPPLSAVPLTKPAPTPPVPPAARPLTGDPGIDPNASDPTWEDELQEFGEEIGSFRRWMRSDVNSLPRELGVDKQRRRRRADARRAYPRDYPWIAPPQVTLGDRALPAVWGRNEYRLPPGMSDLLEVAVPRPPRELDADTEVDLRGDARLLFEPALQPGSATTIEAYARIKTSMSDDGGGLAEYSGQVWTVRAPWSDS